MADQLGASAAAPPSGTSTPAVVNGTYGAASRAAANKDAHVGATAGDAAAKATSAPEGKTYSLLGIEFDSAKPEVQAHLNAWAAGILVAAVMAYFLTRRGWRRRLKTFDIEKAELGIGVGTITLKPNDADRQVAYQIWVELSTRKIGLPIELQNDVITEIYDSWYHFFTVTRELIKSVPVSRANTDSTHKIVNLSIEVLNEGLRPHLTLWQARFRTWYEQQPKATSAYVDPQDLQAKFPRFKELSTDLLRVNQHLIAYRDAMRRIVYEA